MPDLHCFIIPRYNDDPRWRGPAWTTTRADMASYDANYVGGDFSSGIVDVMGIIKRPIISPVPWRTPR